MANAGIINLDFFDVTAVINAMSPPIIPQAQLTQMTQHPSASAGSTATPAPGSSILHLTPIPSHRTPNAPLQPRTFQMAVDEALASRQRAHDFQQTLAASRTEAVGSSKMAVGADGKTYFTEQAKNQTVAAWVKGLQDHKRAGKGEKKE